ncbi:hypothetical protein [Blastomonas sp.]|uniref:hypothetical protein n=1 Tax=Blastomonas sp. TaxID=1909299 RepID=UPI00406A578A
MNEAAISVVQASCLRTYEKKFVKKIEVIHDRDKDGMLTVSNDTDHVITQFSVGLTEDTGYTIEAWIEPGKWYDFAVPKNVSKDFVEAAKKGKLLARAERGVQVASQ